MDHVEVKINGTVWRMPVCYSAAMQIGKQVCDPLQAVLDADSAFAKWTAEDILSILYIGVSAAGSNQTREAVAEAIIKEGLLNYIDIAASYVVALVDGGNSAETTKGLEKKEP